MTTFQHNRATRLRIVADLELANHATALLQSKEEALQRERARLSGHEARSRQHWAETCERAGVALLRARALGAGDELNDLIARGPTLATVSADWQDSMGITYPGEISCTPRPQPGLTATAALLPATDAYQRALAAAADHGAVTAAIERLDHELATTRRRRRAIGDHLVPRLDADLHEIELVLDELDREEAVRTGLAVERSQAGAGIAGDRP